MTSQQQQYTIKNTCWSVSQLIVILSTIGAIVKPKFQRKLRWALLPCKKASMREFIDFLFRVKNTVHPISFAEKIVGGKKTYENIDGNNRINAIWTFIQHPFSIYPEYLAPVHSLISQLAELLPAEQTLLSDFIRNLSYREISMFRRQSELYETRPEIEALVDKLPSKTIRELETHLIRIQTALLFPNNDNFEKTVQININIFENATNEEICRIFSDINKYAGSLTESELLASDLYDTQIAIENPDHNYEIRKSIKTYYDTKNVAGEILSGFVVSPEDIYTFPLNGFDCIVGIQNYCNTRFPNTITPFESEKRVSLCFKLYRIVYGELSVSTVTSENVNRFMEQMMNATEILSQTMDDIFPANVDETIFNQQGRRESTRLCITQLLLVLSAIIGFSNQAMPQSEIAHKIKLALIYNYIVNEIDDRHEMSDAHKLHNALSIERRENRSETYAEKIMLEPQLLVQGLTQKRMHEVAVLAVAHSVKPESFKSKKSKNKRRKLSLVDRLITSAFFRKHVSHSYLEKEFSNEHIIPFSSSWAEDGVADMDRLGNLVPMLAGLNKGRGNGPISYYYDKEPTYCSFFKTHLPSPEEYEDLVRYEKKIPVIMDIEKYNAFCERHEATYIDTFLQSIYA
jgi:hypothetical protein